jgi:hypothetical protein
MAEQPGWAVVTEMGVIIGGLTAYGIISGVKINKQSKAELERLCEEYKEDLPKPEAIEFYQRLVKVPFFLGERGLKFRDLNDKISLQLTKYITEDITAYAQNNRITAHTTLANLSETYRQTFHRTNQMSH